MTVREMLERMNFITTPAKAVKMGFTSDPDGLADVTEDTELFLCLNGIYGQPNIEKIFSDDLLSSTVSGWTIAADDMIIVHVESEFF